MKPFINPCPQVVCGKVMVHVHVVLQYCIVMYGTCTCSYGSWCVCVCVCVHVCWLAHEGTLNSFFSNDGYVYL